MPLLAIIIPAYKSRFLGETLASISQQTDKNFTLYIGDDHSPENIKEICDTYADSINLRYIRFDSNMGGHDLASHWERCIDMSEEPYIWLFSDDDVMPPDAVERINTALNKQERAFYRLPLLVTDEQLNRIGGNSKLDTIEESAIISLMKKFSGERPSAAIEFIFSRELYRKTGKFEHFPIAWCSDDATWFKFALVAGQITHLSGAPVCWRQSPNYNISSSQNFNSQKIGATTLFINWLYRTIKVSGVAIPPQFINHLKQYINTILTVSLNKEFSKKELLRLSREIARFSPKLAIKILYRYL